jgi:hypothetical protein
MYEEGFDYIQRGGTHPIAIRYVRHRQLHQISGFTTYIKSDKLLLETLIGGHCCKWRLKIFGQFQQKQRLF